MRLTYFKFLLIIFCILSGCTENKSRDLSEAIEDLYPDGAYCANVTYYNRDTDKSFEYTLNVEVENGKLTKINWGNGGWMDETQFTPALVDSEGFCMVYANGSLPYQYSISITGTECLVTDSPQTFGDYEGIITRAQCAANYGASDELFNAYLNHRNLNATYKMAPEDHLTFQDCALMHEDLTIFVRMVEIDEKVNKGYIQQVFTRTSGLGIICQTMIVKRFGLYYLLEIAGGNATMGLTSFDTNTEDWQEIMIQENPDVERWTVEVARVLRSGSYSELEEFANYFCR